MRSYRHWVFDNSCGLALTISVVYLLQDCGWVLTIPVVELLRNCGQALTISVVYIKTDGVLPSVFVSKA